MKSILAKAEKQNIQYKPIELVGCKNQIAMFCKALIARQLWRTDGYYRVLNQQDKTITKALQLIK
jgi:carboxyl-terminal processing protease